MAEDLGKKLLTEIDELGLDEIFQTLRLQEETTQSYFRLPTLDRLLQVIAEVRPTAAKLKPAAPTIELTSLASGGGKTHLIYYLTAVAVLPVSLGGKQACAVIIDADSSFSVPRLVQQLNNMSKRLHHREATETGTGEATMALLKHVHILRPQSLSSTVATLDNLPAYLFDESKHHSIDRRVAFVALDSAAAFYWQHRADEDDATLLASTTPTSVAPPKPSGYAQLATALRRASSSFACPIVLTSWHLGPTPPMAHTQGADARSIRPSLPAPLSQMPTLRLVVRRIPVRRFPVGISNEEALREAADRQKAVEGRKFEAVVNEWGVDERTLQKLQAVGFGFGFSINAEGLNLDETTLLA
ncbi:hypothetical protein LTR08_007424 [Meristemomyces frigidus]|nr:hypothetical protein LTR08_007424 [Meristemomyces frigidus]